MTLDFYLAYTYILYIVGIQCAFRTQLSHWDEKMYHLCYSRFFLAKTYPEPVFKTQSKHTMIITIIMYMQYGFLISSSVIDEHGKMACVQ